MKYRHTALAVAALAALSAAVSTFAAPPAASTGPVAHWSFDKIEKNEFPATGPAGRAAEVLGTVKLITGIAGSAASFASDPAGRLIIPVDLLTATKGVFTFEFWLRVAGRSDSYGTCLDAAGNKGFTIRTNNTGRLSVSTDGQWNVISTPESLIEQTWVHVALTADASMLRFYVNGKEAGMLSLANPLRLATSLQLGAVIEGVKQPDGVVIDSVVKQLIGDLDELKLYDRVLTAAEIAAKAGLKAAR